MKKTDIAMIILIASVSVMLTYGAMSQIPLFKDVNDPVEVKTATAISPYFGPDDKVSQESPVTVDDTIFNKEALNPTVKITIGENTQSSSGQGG